MPRTPQQYEEIREVKRELIRKNALQLFATEGYYAASIQDIAAKAGISKGLMYNYYESKEQLLKEIVTEGFDRIMEMIDPDRDGVLTSREMEGLFDELFRILREEREFWSFYFSILPQPGVVRIVHKELRNIYASLLHLLEGYFTTAGYDDPKTEAVFFGSLLDGVFINYFMNHRNYPVEKIKLRLLEMYKVKDG
jgi:AcrR family transcriptional regulator